MRIGNVKKLMQEVIMMKVIKNKKSGQRYIKIIASNSLIKYLVLQKLLMQVNIRMD